MRTWDSLDEFMEQQRRRVVAYLFCIDTPADRAANDSEPSHFESMRFYSRRELIREGSLEVRT